MSTLDELMCKKWGNSNYKRSNVRGKRLLVVIGKLLLNDVAHARVSMELLGSRNPGS